MWINQINKIINKAIVDYFCRYITKILNLNVMQKTHKHAHYFILNYTFNKPLFNSYKKLLAMGTMKHTHTHTHINT